MAGMVQDKKIVGSAFDMFNKFKKGDKSAIHPELRQSIYDIVLTNGGVEEYEVVLGQAFDAKTSDERNAALTALGSASSPALIQRTLDLCLSEPLRYQDIHLLIYGLQGYPEGTKAAWDWVRKNWDQLEKRLASNPQMLSTVVSYTTYCFTHQDQGGEIEAFFENKSTQGFNEILAQNTEAIRASAAGLCRNLRDVKFWLKENKYLQ